MDTSQTLTLVGMVVTVLVSVGTSFAGTLVYVSKFVGRTETQDENTKKDIGDIKNDIKSIYDLIRNGAIHPVCSQVGPISVMANQIQEMQKRISALEVQLREAGKTKPE